VEPCPTHANSCPTAAVTARKPGGCEQRPADPKVSNRRPRRLRAWRRAGHEPATGTAWFHEGVTLGCDILYVAFPLRHDHRSRNQHRARRPNYYDERACRRAGPGVRSLSGASTRATKDPAGHYPGAASRAPGRNRHSHGPWPLVRRDQGPLPQLRPPGIVAAAGALAAIAKEVALAGQNLETCYLSGSAGYRRLAGRTRKPARGKEVVAG
jgi:hypothetical protein